MWTVAKIKLENLNLQNISLILFLAKRDIDL